MQQPIRYYITKSGEEPTVRSVKVAREAPAPELRDDVPTPRAVENGVAAHDASIPREGVKRFVPSTIRKRIPTP